jgi:hypothetical protein
VKYYEIGETFEHQGEKIVCVKNYRDQCVSLDKKHCVFNNTRTCLKEGLDLSCSRFTREDKNDVIFLEAQP